MNGSSLRDTKARKGSAHDEVEISSLVELLEEQDAAMRSLFAKALNLYVSPGADASSEKEKRDCLKQAVEASLTGEDMSC